MAGLFPFLSHSIFPAIIFIIMFGMGLALALADFRSIFATPRAVIIGIACQLILLPVLGLALASVLPISGEVAVGLMILAASPGGVTSNAITLAVRGDVALAVSLTALSTLLVAFTLPLWTGFAIEHFLGNAGNIHIPVGQSVVTLALLTILPVALGMVVRRIAPAVADIGVSIGRRLSVALILFMAVTTTIFNFKFLSGWGVFAESLGVCLSLMLLAMAGSYALTRLFRLPGLQAITIVIEVGVHNLAIALLVSVTIVGLPSVARLPLVYGILMVTIPWLFVRWERARQARVGAV